MSRIDQVNELLKQEIAKIFLEQVEFNPDVMVTVMSADTSDNLETANIWISVFPENKSKDNLNYLNEIIGDIQRSLNRKLAMRFVPRIAFKIDKSEDYASSIDKVFKKIEKNED
jgi:ribosome-binding factor A